jgi:hypothetical protein
MSTSPTASSLERLLAEPLAGPARHGPVGGRGSSGGSRRQRGSRPTRDGRADKSRSSRSGRRGSAMRKQAAGVAAGDCVDHLAKPGLHQGKLAEQDMLGRAGLGLVEGCDTISEASRVRNTPGLASCPRAAPRVAGRSPSGLITISLLPELSISISAAHGTLRAHGQKARCRRRPSAPAPPSGACPPSDHGARLI